MRWCGGWRREKRLRPGNFFRYPGECFRGRGAKRHAKARLRRKGMHNGGKSTNSGKRFAFGELLAFWQPLSLYPENGLKAGRGNSWQGDGGVWLSGVPGSGKGVLLKRRIGEASRYGVDARLRPGFRYGGDEGAAWENASYSERIQQRADPLSLAAGWPGIRLVRPPRNAGAGGGSFLGNASAKSRKAAVGGF